MDGKPGGGKYSVKGRLQAINAILATLCIVFFAMSILAQVAQEYGAYEQKSQQTTALLSNEIINNIRMLEEITKFPIETPDDKQNFIFAALREQQLSYLRTAQRFFETAKMYLNQNRSIEYMAVYNLQGDGIYAWQRQSIYYLAKLKKDAPWVTQTLEARGRACLIPAKEFVDSGLNNLDSDLFCVTRAVVDGRTVQPIGIIVIGIRTSSIDRAFAAVSQFPQQQYAFYYQGQQVLGSFTAPPPEALPVGQIQSKTHRSSTWYIDSAYQYDADWLVVVRTPMTMLTQSIARINFPFLLLFSALLVAIVLIISHIIKSILLPLQTLVEACDRMEGEQFPTLSKADLPQELDKLFASFNAMSGRVDMLVNEVLRKDIARREIELQLLRTQINPHYLYNTLECMHMQAYSNGDFVVSSMAELLGHNLQYGLRNTNQEVDFRTELEHLQEYVTLIGYHYGQQLQVRTHVNQEVLNYRTIKLLLQPLIENAVFHGRKESKVLNIDIMGYLVEDEVHMVVSDDGVGIPSEVLQKILASLQGPGAGKSIGVHNVHRRIQLHYGEAYGLEINSIPGQGTSITIRLPKRR